MKKIKDKNEATVVASSRSRLGKKARHKPIKTGASAQRDFTEALKKLVEQLEGHIEVEPNVNITIARPNKKNNLK